MYGHQFSPEALLKRTLLHSSPIGPYGKRTMFLFWERDSKVWDEPQVILRRSPFMPVSTMMSPKNPLVYNLIHPHPSKESDFSWVAIHDSIYSSWLLSLPWGW